MDEEQRNKIVNNCRRSCACSNPSCPRKEKSENERTFVSFMCESVSVIAFIVFGSIVFWLAVGEILIDFIKKLYYSERHVKIFIGIMFSVLLLSMSIHFLVGGRTHVKGGSKNAMTEKGGTQRHKQSEVLKVTTVDKTTPEQPPPPPPPPTPPPPPPPPPEFMKISLKENHLETLNSEAPVTDITKKVFTLTIADEKKKEVFRTTKSVFIPVLTMEKNRPALVFVLKEILLDDY